MATNEECHNFPMKTKLIVCGLSLTLAMWAISIPVAYHCGYEHGYQRGGLDERACWSIEPATPEIWIHEVVTARRDTTKHPFLRGSVTLAAPSEDYSVNSFPVTFSPR